MQKLLLFSLIIFLSFSCQDESTPATLPDPVLPIPTQAQLDWQQLEYYAFIHFNMNTFSNMEWGTGAEKPAQFNPTELDCRQWAKVAKDAGMKGIILTAKHHDGFCLWPSATTEHSVKNSPWKNGKGDVLKELSEACKEYGLKFGVYLSPWDRNHADYGKPEYITDFRNQLKELLTNYGDVFEVWFDGANGGTGYYGGANEERKVDKLSYYDWEHTYQIIRELQPNAIIFSDAGPGCRWVGNENGHAYPTTWSNIMGDSVYGGMIEYASKWSMGQENGTHWIPAEANVSIRPGWYYHEYEDHKVKSLPHLLDMFYESAGRNATFLLNFPVDKRGLIHENDIEQLEKLTAKLKEDFANDLARNKTVEASNTKDKAFDGNNVTDGNYNSFWASDDGVIKSSLTIDFGKPTTFNRFLIQEHIALGQRVKAFSIETKAESGWLKVASETTIGYKRILRFPDITTTELRVNFLDAKASPIISNIEVYFAPKLIVSPNISRNKAGEVNITVPEEGGEIYYTIDGIEPSSSSQKYEGIFIQSVSAIIQAISIDQTTGKSSEISRTEFDVSAAKWKVLSDDSKTESVIDGDPNTWWTEAKGSSNEIVVDLGESLTIKGFTYLPTQQRWITGFIKDYAFYVSEDNVSWQLIDEGEFGNILNSPILQRIEFQATKGRFIKLKAKTTVDGNPAGFAEVGVLTE